ncbi:MAG: ABC transporter substrate-binding protein [Chloroflexi bacterium HGW-Chloroflexi-3]|nr:MAG: ABC transporter substrate-binding protein [Chloroflexi bacterium HGW-Chloroflexi-3]
MHKKSVVLLITLLILIALLFTACKPAVEETAAPQAKLEEVAPEEKEAEPEQPASKEPIKFGVIQPLTGPVADAGAYVVSGLKIGVDKINAEGGVCGRQLEPIIMDGKNDPQESVNAAELLITRDGVPIIMGAWGSSSTLAVMPVMERNGVPLIVETSSSGKITTPGTPGFDWTYRFSPMSLMESEAAAPYIVDKLGMTKVAILNVNNDWGRGAAEVFTNVIVANGGEIVSEDFIEQTTTDVLPQLTSIKNSNADSILITTGAGQIATILKQYKELGMTQTVLTTGGSNYPVAIMNLSSAEIAEGTYHLVFYVPSEYDLAGDPAVAKWYFEEYYKRGLPDVGLGESYRGFDGVHVIAQAMELAGCDLSPEALQAAIPLVEFKGLSGTVKFDEREGHQSRPNVYLTKIENGVMVVPDFQFD